MTSLSEISARAQWKSQSSFEKVMRPSGGFDVHFLLGLVDGTDGFDDFVREAGPVQGRGLEGQADRRDVLHFLCRGLCHIYVASGVLGDNLFIEKPCQGGPDGGPADIQLFRQLFFRQHAAGFELQGEDFVLDFPVSRLLECLTLLWLDFAMQMPPFYRFPPYGLCMRRAAVSLRRNGISCTGDPPEPYTYLVRRPKKYTVFLPICRLWAIV